MADPAFVRELKGWLRFNAREALSARDGLFSGSSGNPMLPSWLGPRVFDRVFRAQTENRRYARQIETSAGGALKWVEQLPPETHMSYTTAGSSGVPDHLGARFSQPFSVTATVSSRRMPNSPGT